MRHRQRKNATRSAPFNEKLQVTQAELRGTLYAADMKLAQHAWEEAALPRALELLEKQRPRPGEPDLRGFEWDYLHRLCQGGQLFTLPKALKVVFSPDGKRLFSICGDVPLGNWQAIELKVWDAQTGQELRKFALNGVNMVFSPDGKRLASGSDREHQVKVWDTQTGQELLTLKGGSKWVVFSPDGKRLANPSGTEVKLWDAQTGQELPTLKGGPRSYFWPVAFSPDGKRLASNDSGDRTVRVWDAQTGQQLLAIQAHRTGNALELAFSPDGKRLSRHRVRGLPWRSPRGGKGLGYPDGSGTPQPPRARSVQIRHAQSGRKTRRHCRRKRKQASYQGVGCPELPSNLHFPGAYLLDLQYGL